MTGVAAGAGGLVGGAVLGGAFGPHYGYGYPVRLLPSLLGLLVSDRPSSQRLSAAEVLVRPPVVG